MASVSKDIKTFKRQYRKTGSIRSSALSAGYSENVANTGLQHMPKAIRTYVLNRQKSLSKYAALAKEISVEDHENIVRGAIFSNIALGKDRATNSIKLGMQDKRVAMLTPDSATGVIVIQAAPIPSFDSVPAIDAQQLLPATLPKP